MHPIFLAVSVQDYTGEMVLMNNGGYKTAQKLFTRKLSLGPGKDTFPQTALRRHLCCCLNAEENVECRRIQILKQIVGNLHNSQLNVMKTEW